jgi:uncharacterized DUF497 family protein
MPFDFDAQKSAANKVKHGIDFVGAQALWTDPDRLETPARTLDEKRFQIIGQVEGRIWSAFVTYRNGDVRIISVRRARPDEEARYHGD